MRPPPSRAPAESADAVGHVIALLVRFPEIAAIASHPVPGSIELSFVIGRRLDRTTREAVRDEVVEHVRTLLASSAEEPALLAVTCEMDERMTFVRVARDARTLTREELAMLTALFAARFGDALVKSPMQDESPDEDPAADDELVEYAIDALRDPAQKKGLVGFREEKRVVVYFLKARKKAKAAAR
jgi:hypothetical protein